jgi:hypothetical protein
MKTLALCRLVVLSLLLIAPVAGAEPVAVRHPEGQVYGVLKLSSSAGDALADGELIQAVRGQQVESQLVFRFKDGSLHDERVTFSQQKVLSLTRYRLVQRGPSFPIAQEVELERPSGQYRARVQESGKKEEVAEGRLELPADVYNGMALVLLRNLRKGEAVAGHLVVFTPKPRALKMDIAAEGEDGFVVGPITRKATRYLMKLEVGGLVGLIAPLVGKDPPDVRYWIVTDPVAAFVKFEGPFYLNGPLWRIELAGPRWPESKAGAK